MIKQGTLMVSVFLSAAVLAGCARVTPVPPPGSDAVSRTRPDAVADLVAAYGAPSQAAFGSAVFHDQLPEGGTLEAAALARYRYFVGDLWERYGEAAWMGPWEAVYVRPTAASRDIVAELRALQARDAAMSASLLLDEVDDAGAARAALAATYDDPAVTEVVVYTLGDGGAMSGLLVAGLQEETRAATFLVFLLD